MYETDRRLGLGGISAGTCYHDPEEIDYVAATQSSSAPPGVVRALAVGSSHASPEGIRWRKWIHPKQTFFQPNSTAHNAAHARS